MTYSGTAHLGDAYALQAQIDLGTAYNDAVSRLPATLIATELGGQTLLPGVYYSASGTFGITGILTLDAQSDPDAVFIFKTASTLITAANSSINLINGAQYYSIYWQVGSSATLGADSQFVGRIFAMTSITAGARASVQGQLLARNGAVTLDSNSITNGLFASPSPTPTPTTAPTTAAPTTAAPTTAAPTTTAPTTAAPTTAAPTTTAPTTAVPTTTAPTTAVLTAAAITNASTTSIVTTSESTTSTAATFTAATVAATSTAAISSITNVLTVTSTPLKSADVTTMMSAPITSTLPATTTISTDSLLVTETGESLSWATIVGLLLLFTGSIIVWKRQATRR